MRKYCCNISRILVVEQRRQQIFADGTGHRALFWTWPPQRYSSSKTCRIKNIIGISKNISRVFLLTNFRYFGVGFNPISVYFCYDSTANLLAIVDEVTNTPWGERVHYVHITGERNGNHFVVRYAKEMHVSPFFGMHYGYITKYTMPEDTFSLQIELDNQLLKSDPIASANLVEKHVDLVALLDLRAVPLTQSNLLWVLWKFPAMTLEVVFAIYYQALCLWWKGVPFVSHPSKPSAAAAASASITPVADTASLSPPYTHTQSALKLQSLDEHVHPLLSSQEQ